MNLGCIGLIFDALKIWLISSSLSLSLTTHTYQIVQVTHCILDCSLDSSDIRNFQLFLGNCLQTFFLWAPFILMVWGLFNKNVGCWGNVSFDSLLIIVCLMLRRYQVGIQQTSTFMKRFWSSFKLWTYELNEVFHLSYINIFAVFLRY